MKRDWDVIKKWLLKIEDMDNPFKPIFLCSDKDEDIKDLYHLALMGQMKLILAAAIVEERNNCCSVHQLFLTNLGHDILSVIKDKEKWEVIRNEDDVLGHALSFFHKERNLL